MSLPETPKPLVTRETMSTIITIQGTVIAFPTSGEPQNWSEPVVDFATAVEGALAGIVGPADIAPQLLDISAFNPGTDINLPNLAFSTSVVRGAFIRYAVYRTTSTTTVAEAGYITIVYNPTNPSGFNWETANTHVGDAQVSITVTDTGQVQISTAALSGINHSGTCTYAAQALLQTSL
jgi:hypothetical protein